MFVENPKKVAIHPIVLLSIVDHFNRAVGNSNNKRALGVILGEKNDNNYEITNCYGIPFDEDNKETGVWYFDQNFNEIMYTMFQKINIKEKILGFYITGTFYKEHDLEIYEMFYEYCDLPIMCIVDAKNENQLDLPTKAYYSVEELNNQGMIEKKFKHVHCVIEAFQSEEVGVEHLLREIKDLKIDSIVNKMNDKIFSYKSFENKLALIINYLEKILEGKTIPNQLLLTDLQNILTTIPSLDKEETSKAFNNKINDNYLAIFVSSIVKSVISVHDLINNKMENLEIEHKKTTELKAK